MRVSYTILIKLILNPSQPEMNPQLPMGSTSNKVKTRVQQQCKTFSIFQMGKCVKNNNNNNFQIQLRSHMPYDMRTTA